MIAPVPPTAAAVVPGSHLSHGWLFFMYAAGSVIDEIEETLSQRRLGGSGSAAEEELPRRSGRTRRQSSREPHRAACMPPTWGLAIPPTRRLLQRISCTGTELVSSPAHACASDTLCVLLVWLLRGWASQAAARAPRPARTGWEASCPPCRRSWAAGRRTSRRSCGARRRSTPRRSGGGAWRRRRRRCARWRRSWRRCGNRRPRRQSARRARARVAAAATRACATAGTSPPRAARRVSAARGQERELCLCTARLAVSYATGCPHRRPFPHLAPLVVLPVSLPSSLLGAGPGARRLGLGAGRAAIGLGLARLAPPRRPRPGLALAGVRGVRSLRVGRLQRGRGQPRARADRRSPSLAAQRVAGVHGAGGGGRGRRRRERRLLCQHRGPQRLAPAVRCVRVGRGRSCGGLATSSASGTG
jgi:hypothetical protein